MSKFFSFALIILIFQSSLLGVGNAQTQERGKWPDTEEQHLTLLRYAALAEIAYKAPKKHCFDLLKNCPENIATLPNNSPTSVNVLNLNLSRNFINQSASEICPESNRECIDIIKDKKTGEEFIVCEHDTSLPQRLLIAFKYTRQNDELSLLTKALIVASQAIVKNEELKVLEFQQNDSGDRIFGVQGTDKSRLDQLNTTIQKLMEKSCIFDFAVKVAGQFFYSCNEERDATLYTLIGHSLGGAVVQHVAEKLPNLLNAVTECNENKNAKFKAYSFNSFGVSNSIEYARHHDNIYSVRIAGELLEHMEDEWERKQLGHIFRYGMQPSPNQSVSEKFRLHKISTVQEEICRYLYDGGSFKYMPPGTVAP